MKKLVFLLAITVVMVLFSCGGARQSDDSDTSSEASESKSMLDIVKDRGTILCGIAPSVPGYSSLDSNNVWRGFDVDICRAVSAAIFNDPDKVEYRPLSAKERLIALGTGEIDILSRTTTWTIVRDTTLGVNWAGVNFYDGQGFMVSKDKNISSLSELDGAAICVESGTTNELNLADYFRKHNYDYTLVTFERTEQGASALEAGRCDAMTSDQSQLYALRTKFADPESVDVLDELISKEPLGPAVRHGDDQWLDIVRWSLLAMINAEEYGVTSDNASSLKASSDNPNVRRLLGVEGEIGVGMGLANDWAYQIVKFVGNYGESFERNLGKGSPLQLSRGYNALWIDGGLQYGYPIR